MLRFKSQSVSFYFLSFFLIFVYSSSAQAIFDVCVPGSRECVDEASFQVCNDAGDGYEAPVECSEIQGCFAGECLLLCEIAELSPSSMGCSFMATRVDNLPDSGVVNGEDEQDTVVVGNFFSDKTANVQFFFTPDGTNTEQPVGVAVPIPPETTTQFQLTNDLIGPISLLRQGGSYRVASDIPVQAYLHSPINAIQTNDSSALIPEHGLTPNGIISSFAGFTDDEPDFESDSFFNVIALVDETDVMFTPPVPTEAGMGVPAVNPAETGSVTLNRFDTLQVRAGSVRDLSGTIVEANQPIWVVGANRCAEVPVGNPTCDQLHEVMLPPEYWGTSFVGTHSPIRGIEGHLWRIYGGADNVTVTTDPPQPGTPLVLNYVLGFTLNETLRSVLNET